MSKLLIDKTAVITGASRGIGRGIAVALAENGCNIAFTYKSSSKEAKELEKELTGLNVKSKAYRSDASSLEDSNQLVESVVKDFNSIDILVNNAGITKDNLLMRMSEEDFDNVIKTNLKSVFNMSSAIQRLFIKQRKGSIINIGSIVGLKGNPGQSNYAASKAGIIGFTKSLALELGSRNIRANVIAPGFIETEMTENLSENIIENWKNNIPLKRIGKPEDVANACIFLASDMSEYITGQVIQVDGGMLT
ncbi:MAG: 3-oxoacyl-[acyl-carrier-protein] reductase [Flavobacteriaceae bacterium]|nr:3-oxoacyl-[acyl-carrier-protein] reductase [Flavobacteriaceae bacterium]